MKEYKDLKPFELHLGHGPVIDMDGLYNCGAVHDTWQMRTDKSGEYKDIKYYSHDAPRVLELINKRFVVLDHIIDGDKTEFHFIMRRNY